MLYRLPHSIPRRPPTKMRVNDPGQTPGILGIQIQRMVYQVVVPPPAPINPESKPSWRRSWRASIVGARRALSSRHLSLHLSLWTTKRSSRISMAKSPVFMGQRCINCPEQLHGGRLKAAMKKNITDPLLSYFHISNVPSDQLPSLPPKRRRNVNPSCHPT